MIVCYKCGKPIKRKVTSTIPSRLALQLGIDFPKSYHPTCFVKAGKEAAIESGKDGGAHEANT